MRVSNTYNQDCISFMKETPDKFFNLAIVDPPYGKNRYSNRKDRRREQRRGEVCS